MVEVARYMTVERFEMLFSILRTDYISYRGVERKMILQRSAGPAVYESMTTDAVVYAISKSKMLQFCANVIGTVGDARQLGSAVLQLFAVVSAYLYAVPL